MQLFDLYGAPVFTEVGGIGYIFKPDFGYVIGKIREDVKELLLLKRYLHFFLVFFLHIYLGYVFIY